MDLHNQDDDADPALDGEVTTDENVNSSKLNENRTVEISLPPSKNMHHNLPYDIEKMTEIGETGQFVKDEVNRNLNDKTIVVPDDTGPLLDDPNYCSVIMNTTWHSHNSDLTPKLLDNRTIQFLFYALGICVVYFISGLLAEKILKGKYGEHSEKFDFVFVFVFFQTMINYLYSEFLLCTIFKHEVLDKTFTRYYAIAALTTFLSMFLGNKALEWISYPTQVIGKSVKPIPVMIFNAILGKQNYSLKKYCFVVIVVFGVTLFMFHGWQSKSSSEESAVQFTFGLGELLVALSLITDGLTGAIQERMRHDFQTQPGSLMMNINKWSILYVGISMIVSLDFLDFFHFAQKYPYVLYYLLVYSCCSAIGQTFIFLMISHFGTLSCTLTTTTRKFFTILGSIIIFRHTMSLLQWIATFLVFLGLLLDTYFSNKDRSVH